MKSLGEFYKEIKDNEELKKEFISAFKEGRTEEFLKSYECDASASDVNDFLSECKRPETGLIESYKDLKVESEDGNNIRINVELKPFHAMENFYIELTGKKEEAGYNWNSNAEVREK